MLEKIRFYLQDFIVLSVWFYLIIQIFFFNLDLYIVSNFPILRVFFDLKFIITSIVIIILVLLKKANILNLIYFIAFPILYITYKLPKFIFEKLGWNFFIVFVNKFIESIFSFKEFLLIVSIIILLSCIVLLSNNVNISILGLIGLAVFYPLYLCLQIYRILNPKSAFTFYNNIIDFSEKTITGENDLSILKKDDPIFVQTLSNYIFFHQTTKLFLSKLFIFKNSNINIFSYILNFVIIFITTTFLFTLINFSLFKIDIRNFMLTKNVDFFDFYYYTFNNFFNTSISEIQASSNYAKIVDIIIKIVSISFIGILIGLSMQFKSEKDSNRLNEIIANLESKNSSISSKITLYNLHPSVELALIELSNTGNYVAKFIQYLNKK